MVVELFQNIPAVEWRRSLTLQYFQPDFHARTKHINIRYHFIRQCIEDGLINYQYLETSDMVADCLTKALPRNKHERFAQFMGLGMARSGGSIEV